MKKLIRKHMKKVSGRLNRQSALWLVLVLVVVGVSFLVYNRVSNNRDDNQTLDADASAQNLDFTEVTAGLLNMANEYRKASPEQKPALEQSMVQVAMERRDQLLMAMDTNPKAVARATIPAGLAKQLPSEISRFIEEDTTVEGVVDVVFVDYKDKENGKNPLEYTLTDSRSKKQYKIKTKEPLDRVVSGTKIRVKGTVLDNNIVPQDDGSIVVTSQVTTSAATQKKVALLLINFQNSPTTYETTDTARAKLFTNPDSVNAFYKESSYGKIELVGHLRPDGDVFGYYTVPYNNDNCNDYQLWSNSAKTMAAADGFVSTNYNSTLYLFDDNNLCPFAGRASVGGNPGQAWLSTSSVNFSVTAHEFGHNLGMLHASAFRCTDASGTVVSISSTCARHEYSDPTDVMGGSLKGHPNNHFKSLATQYNITNWIPAENIVTLASGQSGTYTLAPMQPPLTGTQTIRIPKSYSYISGNAPTPGYYYLEFRQPFGFDNSTSNPTIYTGVSIRLARGFSETDYTNFIDTVPETPNTFYDGVLTPGKTFTDTDAGITITTNSVSASGAEVNITTTSMPCTRQNPSLVIDPRYSGGTAGSTVVYNYILTNQDSSGCGSSTFNVALGTTGGWYMIPSSISETLLPGQSITRSIGITSPVTAAVTDPGTYYNVTLTATNTANSTYKASSAIYYAVTGAGTPPDPSSITTNITSPISGAVLKARSIITITATATDSTSSIASVAFYVNGKLQCTDTTAPYSCNWKVPSGKKSYQLYTVATNSAGITKNSTTVNVTAK